MSNQGWFSTQWESIVNFNYSILITSWTLSCILAIVIGLLIGCICCCMCYFCLFCLSCTWRWRNKKSVQKSKSPPHLNGCEDTINIANIPLLPGQSNGDYETKHTPNRKKMNKINGIKKVPKGSDPLRFSKRSKTNMNLIGKNMENEIESVVESFFICGFNTLLDNIINSSTFEISSIKKDETISFEQDHFLNTLTSNNGTKQSSSIASLAKYHNDLENTNVDPNRNQMDTSTSQVSKDKSATKLIDLFQVFNYNLRSVEGLKYIGIIDIVNVNSNPRDYTKKHKNKKFKKNSLSISNTNEKLYSFDQALQGRSGLWLEMLKVLMENNATALKVRRQNLSSDSNHSLKSHLEDPELEHLSAITSKLETFCILNRRILLEEKLKNNIQLFSLKKDQQRYIVGVSIQDFDVLWQNTQHIHAHFIDIAYAMYIEILKHHVTDWRGEFLHLNKSFAILSFSTIAEAFEYAMSLQRVLLRAPWPTELLRFANCTKIVIEEPTNNIIFRGFRLMAFVDIVSAQHSQTTLIEKIKSNLETYTTGGETILTNEVWSILSSIEEYSEKSRRDKFYFEKLSVVTNVEYEGYQPILWLVYPIELQSRKAWNQYNDTGRINQARNFPEATKAQDNAFITKEDRTEIVRKLEEIFPYQSSNRFNPSTIDQIFIRYSKDQFQQTPNLFAIDISMIEKELQLLNEQIDLYEQMATEYQSHLQQNIDILNSELFFVLINVPSIRKMWRECFQNGQSKFLSSDLEKYFNTISVLISENNGNMLNIHEDSIYCCFQHIENVVTFTMDLQLRLLEVPWTSSLLEIIQDLRVIYKHDIPIYNGFRVRAAIQTFSTESLKTLKIDNDALRSIYAELHDIISFGIGGETVISNATWQILQFNNIFTKLDIFPVKEEEEDIWFIVPKKLSSRFENQSSTTVTVIENELSLIELRSMLERELQLKKQTTNRISMLHDTEKYKEIERTNRRDGMEEEYIEEKMCNEIHVSKTQHQKSEDPQEQMKKMVEESDIQVKTLKNENTSLVNQNAELLTTTKEQAIQISRLTSHCEDLQELLYKVSSNDSAEVSLKNQISSLNLALNNKSSELNSFVQENKLLVEKLTFLEAELHQTVRNLEVQKTNQELETERYLALIQDFQRHINGACANKNEETSRTESINLSIIETHEKESDDRQNWIQTLERMSNENKKLHAQIMQMGSEATQLSEFDADDLSRLEEEWMHIQNQNQVLHDTLNYERIEHEKAIIEAREKIATLERELNDKALNAPFNNENELIALYKQRIETLEQNIQMQQEGALITKEKQRGLESENIELKSSIAELENDIRNLKLFLSQQLEDHEIEYHNLEQEVERKLSEFTIPLDVENANLRKTVTELQRSLQILRYDNESLNSQKTTHNSEIDFLQAEVKGLFSRNQTLLQNLKEYSGMLQEMKELKEENKILRNQILNLSTRSSNNFEDISFKFKSIDEQNNSLIEEIKRLTRKVNALTLENLQYQELETNSATIERKNHELSRTLHTLRKKHEEDVEQLKMKVSSLEQSIQEAEGILKSKFMENEELRMKLLEKENQFSTFVAFNEDIKAKLNDTIAQQQSRNGTLSNENATLIKKLEATVNLSEAVRVLEQENYSLRHENEKVAGQLLETLSEFKKSKIDHITKVQQLIHENELLSKEIASRQDKESLQYRIQQQEKQIIAQKNALAELKRDTNKRLKDYQGFLQRSDIEMILQEYTNSVKDIIQANHRIYPMTESETSFSGNKPMEISQEQIQSPLLTIPPFNYPPSLDHHQQHQPLARHGSRSDMTESISNTPKRLPHLQPTSVLWNVFLVHMTELPKPQSGQLPEWSYNLLSQHGSLIFASDEFDYVREHDLQTHSYEKWIHHFFVNPQVNMPSQPLLNHGLAVFHPSLLPFIKSQTRNQILKNNAISVYKWWGIIDTQGELWTRLIQNEVIASLKKVKPLTGIKTTSMLVELNNASFSNVLSFLNTRDLYCLTHVCKSFRNSLSKVLDICCIGILELFEETNSPSKVQWKEGRYTYMKVES